MPAHNGIFREDKAWLRTPSVSADLWADDIPSYPVEIRAGAVWVTVQSNGSGAMQRWQRRLRAGRDQNLRLVQGNK
jgi:hypothetical protein